MRFLMVLVLLFVPVMHGTCRDVKKLLRDWIRHVTARVLFMCRDSRVPCRYHKHDVSIFWKIVMARSRLVTSCGHA